MKMPVNTFKQAMLAKQRKIGLWVSLAGPFSAEAVAKAHFEPVFERKHLGLTLQIDENPGMVYDGRHNNLNALFPL